MINKLVIVGAGHAAGQAIASLKQQRFAGQIILVGKEPHLPYQRPPLSKKFLSDEISIDRLYLKPSKFYDDPQIKKYLDTNVTAIDRNKKKLQTNDGKEIYYDKLILATGSRIRRIDISGSNLNGVHYLRNIADVIKIKSEIDSKKNVVIIGAGYIGLEVAAIIRQLGHNVTVLEKADRVMSRVVSPQISDFFEIEHVKHGVDLRLSTNIIAFNGKDTIDNIEISSGEKIPADIVIVGVGIKPNIELAADTGLKVNNGIIVNNRCQTNDSDIYAIGDCTLHPSETYNRNIRLESVHNALEQAKIAVSNICGIKKIYSQVPWFWSDQYNLKLQIAGLSEGYDRTIIKGNISDRSFACLYFKDGQLIATDAINSATEFVISKSLIKSKKILDLDKLEDKKVNLKDFFN
ncbi:MAG: pyridine nucleotide-disulfide oxidoreductase [Gammaproteobacteria bacterium]|nr:pyridine nucleotide-disulfide oxidoreductase [Gammaproteobacteria bacterium]